jgi:hypothetical protein
VLGAAKFPNPPPFFLPTPIRKNAAEFPGSLCPAPSFKILQTFAGEGIFQTRGHVYHHDGNIRYPFMEFKDFFAGKVGGKYIPGKISFATGGKWYHEDSRYGFSYPLRYLLL